jgi:cellulose synthase operon protein C
VPAPPHVTADAVVVQAGAPASPTAGALDAPLLFHYALEADRRGDRDDARRWYERLLGDFPTSELKDAVQFNLGLLSETVPDFAAAAKYYEQVGVAPVPVGHGDRRTWLDANFRLGVCLGKLNDWWRAVGAFDRIVEEPWVEDDERLEALVGRGIALKQAGDPEAATASFSRALSVYRKLNEVGPFDDRGLAAEAAYWSGEIKAEEYAAIKLEFPVTALRAQLERKCVLLLEAQGLYFRAIHFGDAHTAAVAGLRIGWLYESLYDMIVGIDVPPDLTAEQTEVYHQEVRDRVMVLVKKALIAYERSLQVGRRAPTAAPWVARLEEAVARLRAVYLLQEGGS